MKAVMIIHNKAVSEQIQYIFEKLSIKAYTRWETVYGQGLQGEPRMGTHTWPEENSAIYVVNEAEKIDKLAEALEHLDASNPEVGIKMFCWHVEKPFSLIAFKPFIELPSGSFFSL